MKQLLFFLLFPLMLSGCALVEPPEYQETRFQMDTVCTIRTDNQEALLAAFRTLEEIQEVSDFHKETSTVSAINRAGMGIAVPLDNHTETMIDAALTVSEKSGGAFDITIAPIKELWAFQEGSQPPKPEDIQRVLPTVGYRQLQLDTKSHTLTKTRDGVKIDLGAVAKGYGADMAKKAMIEAGATWGVLDLGGNVLVFGENPKSPDGSWKIGIQKPFSSAGDYEKTITLKEGAVVTSGIYQRYFIKEGKRYHHILNPQNGYPVENNLQSVTISGNSGLLADCLSTACLVLGEAEGQRLSDAFLMNFIPITEETK